MMNQEELIMKMKETPQTETQSVWDHGQSVQNYMFDLLDHLRNGTPLKYEWKLPEWIYDQKLLENLPSDETLKLYTLYHDCGKPFCIEYDSNGRKHFPNHAEVSYETFKNLFDDTIAADLIRRDMDFHLLKADGMDKFISYEYCTTLILSALAEIHSNCAMFGGIDSTSFKIKWKHTNKRGRQVLVKLK
jgi:hypothetical protein